MAMEISNLGRSQYDLKLKGFFVRLLACYLYCHTFTAVACASKIRASVAMSWHISCHCKIASLFRHTIRMQWNCAAGHSAF